MSPRRGIHTLEKLGVLLHLHHLPLHLQSNLLTFLPRLYLFLLRSLEQLLQSRDLYHRPSRKLLHFQIKLNWIIYGRGDRPLRRAQVNRLRLPPAIISHRALKLHRIRLSLLPVAILILINVSSQSSPFLNCS